jgi:hypothetical protein
VQVALPELVDAIQGKIQNEAVGKEQVKAGLVESLK